MSHWDLQKDDKVQLQVEVAIWSISFEFISEK